MKLLLFLVLAGGAFAVSSCDWWDYRDPWGPPGGDPGDTIIIRPDDPGDTTSDPWDPTDTTNWWGRDTSGSYQHSGSH